LGGLKILNVAELSQPPGGLDRATIVCTKVPVAVLPEPLALAVADSDCLIEYSVAQSK